jgi:hypothetical protein
MSNAGKASAQVGILRWRSMKYAAQAAGESAIRVGRVALFFCWLFDVKKVRGWGFVMWREVGVLEPC